MSTVQANPARLSSFLASLFPDGVVAAELRTPGDRALLYPEESAHLTRAAPKRVDEYAAGRLCARRALQELGILDFPLRPGTDRRPLWPDSVIGSITHTAGFCGAVVAHYGMVRALGVDAERVGRVSANLWTRICTESEIEWLQQLSAEEQGKFSALIFSAKEAFYKCQYTLTEEWLYFHDATLEILDATAGRGIFLVHPLKPMKLSEHAEGPWIGRFEFVDNVVVTGMAIDER